MDENAIEILHHNRDRDALMARCDIRAFGDTTTDERKQELATRAYMAESMLTPSDDTKMLFKHEFIEEDKIDSPDYVYSYKDVELALEPYIDLPMVDTDDRIWLNKRGVSNHQIRKFGLFSFSTVMTELDRIQLGIEIHPATRKWVEQKTPEGVVIPVKTLEGKAIGCFLRFLSTVPKIKFGSAVPGAYVFTNLMAESEPKNIYFVEGVFDGLAVDKCGHHFICPSSGFWTPEQIFIADSILDRFPDCNKYAAFDNDRIGAKGTAFTCMVLKDHHVVPRLFNDPDCKDMSELVNKLGKNISFRNLRYCDVKEAVDHYQSFSYERIVTYDHYLDGRQAAYSNENYNWCG